MSTIKNTIRQLIRSDNHSIFETIARLPLSLAEVTIGEKTAGEINWIK